MYKITLMDENTPSFVSWIALFFTEDINQFYDEWEKLETSEERKERFLESLSGKIVTDCYSDDEEFNIIQKDDVTEIIEDRKYFYTGEKRELVNGWDWKAEVYINKLVVNVKWICFKNEYYKIAKFKMEGVAEDCCINGKKLYRNVKCYGNPILKTNYGDVREFKEEKQFFSNDTIESICYIHLKTFNSLSEVKKEIKDYEFNDEDFKIMTADILGEAG